MNTTNEKTMNIKTTHTEHKLLNTEIVESQTQYEMQQEALRKRNEQKIYFSQMRTIIFTTYIKLP